MRMIEENDWRLRGQEEYLQNKDFCFMRFIPSENGNLHIHCEFCWHKFMETPEGVEDCSSEGYCSSDGKYWVCEECFKDLKEKFNWKLIY